MKFTTIAGLLLLSGASSWSAAEAQSIPAYKAGLINRIYGDPSDVVLQLDSNGPCGSALFHIQRTATNFHELTSLMYTAASMRKPVNLYVSSCNGTRNIVDVGDASFQ